MSNLNRPQILIGGNDNSIGMDSMTLYTSNQLFYEILFRMIIIPAVLLFLAYRFLVGGALSEE
jgi:hypothetical protein